MSNVVNAWYETPSLEIVRTEGGLHTDSIDACVKVVSEEYKQIFGPNSKINISPRSIHVKKDGTSKQYVAVTRRTNEYPDEKYQDTCILVERVEGWQATKNHFDHSHETRCIDPDLTIESGCKKRRPKIQSLDIEGNPFFGVYHGQHATVRNYSNFNSFLIA